MKIRLCGFVAILWMGANMGSAAIFNAPTTTNANNLISGNAPNGLTWESVATGAVLPIRSSTTSANGQNGAVAYLNVTTGQLQIDPRGWNISVINFTYTTGTTNPVSSTPGPFLYALGTSPSTNLVSLANGTANQRTLPVGTWALINSSAARIGGAVSLTTSPTLSTTYDAGNGASSTGWFNQPWSFPYAGDAAGAGGLINASALSSMTIGNFKVFGITTHLNKNILGYGDFQGMFQYAINGVIGSQLGPVIPVTFTTPPTAVPEPSSLMLAGLAALGLCGIGYCRHRIRS